jgi:hypothetical protein
MVLQKENLNYQIKGNFNGQGIDFSKDFKVINSQKITGEIQSAD